MLAILGQRSFNLRLQPIKSGVRGPRHKERTNLGPDEVIGATGPEEGQVFGVRGVYELQHVSVVLEGGDPAILGTHTPAQERSDLDCQLLAVGAARDDLAAETDGTFGVAVTLNELA